MSGVYPVTITVTDNAGFSGTASFTWTAVGPIITSVSPNAGPGAGGKQVRIGGSGFVGATSVMFGSVAAALHRQQEGHRDHHRGAAHAAGVVDVVVTTPSGPTIVTSTDHYTYGDRRSPG